jgi:hypothetical protein
VAVAGQQTHGEDDDRSRSGPTEPEADPNRALDDADPADGDAAHAADGDDESDSSVEVAASEASPRPGPGVPLRLLLLVTVLNVLLAAGLLTVRPPWRVERATEVPPLPAQVAELQVRVQRGEHGTPYTLSLTDDELTATARYFLAQSQDVPFSQVRIGVVDQYVEVTGVTTSLAVAVPVRVVANVAARNGAPVVSVVDVGIGGLALPSFVREQVLTEANRAVDLSRYDLAVTVDSVARRTGVLDVRGTVR